MVVAENGGRLTVATMDVENETPKEAVNGLIYIYIIIIT